MIVVDQLRFPQWFCRRRRGVRAAAEPAAPERRRGVVRAPLHRLQRLHARALDAADRPVHPPDGLHDHRREHARSRLSHVGHDAARTRLPHALATASGTSPTTTTTGRPATGEAALERYGFAGGVYPSPDGAPGQGWRVDPRIAASSTTGSRRRAAPGRGARPSRSSTRTTSPGGTRGATASPRRPRRRRGRAACRPTSRRPSC